MPTAPNPVRTRVFVVSVVLALIAVASAARRLDVLGGDFEFMIPELVYDVTVTQTVTGHGESATLQTYLPQPDDRQTVVRDENRSAGFDFDPRVEGGNRIGLWKTANLEGKHTVAFEYRVRTRAVEFDISPEFQLGETQAGGAATDDLEPTETIQSAAPEIVALAESLRPSDGQLASYLRAVFDRVQGLGFKPFKGTTDALTALRLGEASCNGRARLFVALMRAQGIQARLVGGLVLRPGKRRTSHQWVEVRIGAHWVPMDPTNNHFASLPHNYLALYRGDEVLFKHSADLGFRYQFHIRKHLVPAPEVDRKRHAIGLWAVFNRLGIDLDLLRVVVMVPLGAVIIVIFRNVLGFHVFGTFLPALIAASLRHTGFLMGMAAFAGVIVLVSVIRRLTQKLQLLHSPQLAILLTSVVGLMLGVAALADAQDVPRLARFTLFPVAIMSITAERFALMEIEEGRAKAWVTLARTMVVVYFCYLAMTSLSLQILFLAFPEMLLLLVIVDIWLGRWTGLRLSEWFRFRALLARERGSVA
jgi:transglutaminase-like putative cysteine protease